MPRKLSNRERYGSDYDRQAQRRREQRLKDAQPVVYLSLARRRWRIALTEEWA